MNAAGDIEAAVAKLEWLKDDEQFGKVLAETLHCTIDAQLDFLRYARGWAGSNIPGTLPKVMVEFGLEFARAILGDDS